MTTLTITTTIELSEDDKFAAAHIISSTFKAFYNALETEGYKVSFSTETESGGLKIAERTRGRPRRNAQPNGAAAGVETQPET